MRRIVVHLVGGETVESRVTKPNEPEKVETFKEYIKRAIAEDAGWYLTVELPNGNDAIIPGDRVLWVEFQP